MTTISWKAPEQKHPLLFKVRPSTKEITSVLASDVDAKNTSRKFEMSTQPPNDVGPLYFELMTPTDAKVFWSHLIDANFLAEIWYPSNNKVEKPRKDVVTVYQMENQTVFDVDGVQYAFLHSEIADPLIKDIPDPKVMAAELARDLMDRPAKK